MAIHAGPTSLVASIEQDLFDFIKEWHQKGFEVNCFTLLRKAGQLKPELLDHSEPALKICLMHFLAKKNLMHRIATHKAQCDTQEVEGEALDFLKYIRPCLEGGHCSPDFIINMDQTPVYHAMCSGPTIDCVGTCMLHPAIASVSPWQHASRHLDGRFSQWLFQKV